MKIASKKAGRYLFRPNPTLLPSETWLQSITSVKVRSDNFYNEPKEVWEKWASMGIQALEMESYALFQTAAQAHKEALAIVTISDSLITHEETTPEERQTSFTHMMEVALDCIVE